MKILVFGPGVIGTLYAARLQESGQLVTVLARGERLAEIRRHGLTLEDVVSGRSIRSVSAPRRRSGCCSWFSPTGAGGDVGRAHCSLCADLATADDARRIERAKQRARAESGGSVQGGRLFDHDIGRHGWVAEGPCLFRHSRQWRDLYGWGQLPASVRGQRQPDSDDQGCAGRVRRRALAWPDRDAIPPDGPLYVAAASFAVSYWRRFFATDMADYVFGRHARSASREMREIASDCLTLLEKTGVEAPALHQLYQAIDAYAVQG